MEKGKTVCFDGVIHSYKSGWKGVSIIPDDPVDGIGDVIRELKDLGYTIIIHSARCVKFSRKNAIEEYCKMFDIPYDVITAAKPSAFIYVDDRRLKFEGDTSSLVEEIQTFQSYLDKEKVRDER